MQWDQHQKKFKLTSVTMILWLSLSYTLTVMAYSLPTSSTQLLPGEIENPIETKFRKIMLMNPTRASTVHGASYQCIYTCYHSSLIRRYCLVLVSLFKLAWLLQILRRKLCEQPQNLKLCESFLPRKVCHCNQTLYFVVATDSAMTNRSWQQKQQESSIGNQPYIEHEKSKGSVIIVGSFSHGICVPCNYDYYLRVEYIQFLVMQLGWRLFKGNIYCGNANWWTGFISEQLAISVSFVQNSTLFKLHFCFQSAS